MLGHGHSARGTGHIDIVYDTERENGEHRAAITALASPATPRHRLTICDRLCRRSRCARARLSGIASSRTRLSPPRCSPLHPWEFIGVGGRVGAGLSCCSFIRLPHRPHNDPQRRSSACSRLLRHSSATPSVSTTHITNGYYRLYDGVASHQKRTPAFTKSANKFFLRAGVSRDASALPLAGGSRSRSASLR